MQLFQTLVILVLLIFVSGCNTTRGFGQDVQATGEVIEETAEEARRQM